MTPELREKVLRGTLFDFRCSGCGVEQVIAYRFLYHDMERRLMCWMVWERPGAPVTIEPGMNHGAGALELDGYRLRVVGTIEALTETVLMREAGLDDVAVQMLKATLRAKLNASGMRIYFSHVEEGSLFFALVGPDRPALTRLPMPAYDQARELHRPLGTGYQIVDIETGARALAAG